MALTPCLLAMMSLQSSVVVEVGDGRAGVVADSHEDGHGDPLIGTTGRSTPWDSLPKNFEEPILVEIPRRHASISTKQGEEHR
jgi:hypothetical protein